MAQLQAVLAKQGSSIDVPGKIVPQMRAAASHVLSAALAAMSSAHINHCFELFGLDFMIDENEQVRMHGGPATAIQHLAVGLALPPALPLLKACLPSSAGVRIVYTLAQ